jgi:glycine oxidase
MNPDIIILGGGIIGRAIALELVLASDLNVAIYERGRQGGEASWAAAGMLGAQAEAQGADKLFELSIASRAIFADFIAQVEALSEAKVGYYLTGTIAIALTAEEQSLLKSQYQWQIRAGLPVEELTASQVHQLVPTITAEARAGYYLPAEHQVDNRQLMQQLSIALQGRVREYSTPVVGLLTASNKVIGVETVAGKHYANIIVNTLGSWSNQIGPAGILALPLMTPVRGQMLAVTGQSLPMPVLRWQHTYLVPRQDGRLVIGSTMENVGYTSRVTVAGVQDLLNRATHLVPSLTQATFLESWAGLRPKTPDGLPILGHHPYWEQLILAVGHYRHGILLAPITAKLIAALILRSQPIDPAFNLTRFHSVLAAE